MLTFLGLSHMVDATQHDGVGGGVRKDVNVCRTCTLTEKQLWLVVTKWLKATQLF